MYEQKQKILIINVEELYFAFVVFVKEWTQPLVLYLIYMDVLTNFLTETCFINYIHS